MTRQQKFRELVAGLDLANNGDTDEAGYKEFQRAERALAWYVFRHADKITVASDPPKAKRK